LPQYSWVSAGSDSPAAVRKPIASNQNICDNEYPALYLYGKHASKCEQTKLGFTTWFMVSASHSKAK